MARNTQGQGAYQVQTQTQQLTPQQVLLVRLTELPLNDLRERIEKELADNPWLQGEHRDSGNSDNSEEIGFPESSEPSETSGLSESSESSESYDDVDDGIPRDPNRGNGEEQRSRELGDNSESFFDHLVDQLGEYNLTEHEQEVMKYLIGSLADDGLMRTPLQQIADEMDIYQNVRNFLKLSCTDSLPSNL